MRWSHRLGSYVLSLSCLVFCLSSICCGGGGNATGSGSGGGSSNGGGGGSSSVSAVSVSCSPSSVSVNQTSQCTATVTGTGSFDSSVIWSVDNGTIDQSGNYTAPGSATTAVVKATSKQDTTKFATATIAVSAGSGITSVSVSCTSLDVQTTHTSLCTSNVEGTGTFSTSVAWSVTSGLGSIEASGLFTAPGQPGVTTISAVSMQDATKSATRTIIVSPHVTVDQPDDSQGNQVHVLYVLPSDGADRFGSLASGIATSVASWENWFSGQTSGSLLRLDTAQGALDLTFIRLHRTDAQMESYGIFVRDQIEYELLANGFSDPSKIYLAIYDGGGTNIPECGGGALPPALPGSVAALYLNGTPQGAPACNTNSFTNSVNAPGYLEFSSVHEIVHMLGFVPTCAPHQTLSGHVSDSNTDLMYAGPQPWMPSVLDFNRDDYYKANISGCLDLSNSDFITPASAVAAPPPGWPYSNLEPSSCSTESTLRSAGNVATNVEFVNGTESPVNVYWLDSNGTRQLFKNLNPFEGYIQPTSVGNYWVMANSSGQCLEIYSATASLGRAILTK